MRALRCRVGRPAAKRDSTALGPFGCADKPAEKILFRLKK
jgi:hypothetical protein